MHVEESTAQKEKGTPARRGNGHIDIRWNWISTSRPYQATVPGRARRRETVASNRTWNCTGPTPAFQKC